MGPPRTKLFNKNLTLIAAGADMTISSLNNGTRMLKIQKSRNGFSMMQ
jgi:hypothetical protein